MAREVSHALKEVLPQERSVEKLRCDWGAPGAGVFAMETLSWYEAEFLRCISPSSPSLSGILHPLESGRGLSRISAVTGQDGISALPKFVTQRKAQAQFTACKLNSASAIRCVILLYHLCCSNEHSPLSKEY